MDETEVSETPNAGESSQLSASLNFLHAFGLVTGVRDNISHVGETTIVFPVGRHVAMFNTETKETNFLLETVKIESINAIAVSPNKKYVAVSETLAGPPEQQVAQLSIFSVANEKRMRTLTYTECASKEFVGLSFSSDSKMLVTQTGGPEWALLVWQWHAQPKVLAMVKLQMEVRRTSVSPWDSQQVCTSGPGLLKIWRLQESSLKCISLLGNKVSNQNFSDHVWLPADRLIAVTKTGDILIFDQGELLQTIVGLDGHAIECIITFSGGFLVGGQSGTLQVFERNDVRDKSDAQQLYHPLKTFRAPVSGSLVGLSLSPSEESVACCFSSNQLALFPIASVDVLKEDEQNFNILASGFHQGAIVDMDVCVRKPLVVTCGQDRTVRIWNYVEKSCELLKSFSEEIYSIAIHPSGFYLVAGFNDKLRLYNVLVSDLRLIMEYPIKMCREVRFSHGGHYIAAVNATHIVLYGTYSTVAEKLGLMIGHTGLVRSICFSADDNKLVSAGIDGAVYEWNVNKCVRTEENVLRSCHYSDVVYNAAATTVVACSDDKKLREISNGATTRDIATGSSRVNGIFMSHADRVLFAVTAAGSVLMYYWTVGEHQEFAVHCGSASHCQMSADGSYLFTAADDGSIFMFDVQVFENNELIGTKKFDRASYKDVVLVTREEVEEQQLAMKEMEARIVEIESQTELRQSLFEKKMTDRLKKLEDEKEAQEIASENRFDVLRRRKEQQELEAADAIQSMERAHMKAAEELEALYERKLAAEQAKYRALLAEKEDLDCANSEQLEMVRNQYKGVIASMKTEYKEQQEKQMAAHRKLNEENLAVKFQFKQQMSQQDEDHEQEMLTAMTQHNTQLAEKEEALMTLKGHQAMMKRKHEKFNAEIDEFKKTLQKRESEISKLQEFNADAQRTIEILKNDIREREITIDNKEKRINELRLRSKELEKIKFVLDYKYKELKKEIEPKDTHISNMKDQIREMDHELERDVRTNHSLGQALNDKAQKITNLNLEIRRQRRQLGEKERVISLFVADLEKLVTEIDPAHWRDAIRQLYRTYVKRNIKDQDTRDTPGTMDEFARQREYMEQSLQNTKMRAVKNEETMKLKFQTKTTENALLIDELNQLRRDNKVLTMKLEQLESEQKIQGFSTVANKSRPPTAGSVGLTPTGTPGSSRAQTPSGVFASGGGLGATAPTAGKSGGTLKKGTALKYNDIVTTERYNMAALLQQVDDNNVEIEAQRFEIRQLKEQVAMLLNSSSSVPHPPTSSSVPPRPTASAPSSQQEKRPLSTIAGGPALPRVSGGQPGSFSTKPAAAGINRPATSES